MIHNKKKLPRIGMRIIKSAIGVFLCYVVDLVRGEGGLVFYSLLAVLWCMQDYVSETKEKAAQRSIGTVIGAVFGLLYLLGDKLVSQGNKFMSLGDKLVGLSDTIVGHGNQLITGIIVSAYIIVLIYVTVLIHKKQASYFSCVVFLSIIVNHIGDTNPYLFVFNRFLDTMIGIAIGVFVNCFSLPREKHTEILFVSGIDDILLGENGGVSDYTKVELNRMLDEGLLFTISTMRTPASLIEVLKDLRLNLPMIVMDGAALYDLHKKSYKKVYVLSNDISSKLSLFFKEHDVPCFANVIIDDLLIIYYENTTNEVYNEIVDSLRSSLYRNYVNRPLPPNQEVVYFMLIEETWKMNRLYNALLDSEIGNKVKVLCYESEDYKGYSYMKIYNHNASKANMLDYLQREIKCEKIVTYGTIPNRYTYFIGEQEENRLVHEIKKEFEPFVITRKRN